MMTMKNELLKRVKKRPIEFGKSAGFNDLTNLHNDWLRLFLFSNQDETLLAHRGSYKTTTLSIAIALMIILYPHKSIIFFRKTDSDVIEVVNQTKKLLTDDYFQTLAYHLWDEEPMILTKESSYEIDTNLKQTTRGSSQLLGSGIKASITGKHADIVITDDIVNIQDRISKAEREFIKLQYQELQNIKNRGGRFINTGTTWHKEDAISMMPNQSRYTIYDTGLITKEQEKHLRQAMTPSLFSANYELKHIADEDALFTSPKFTDKKELIYDGFGQIDASYGGADGTAYTVFKEVGNKLIGFGKRWDKHVDDCLSEIKLLHDELRTGTIYNETNADKGYLAKELRALNIPVQTYHEKQNKFVKITTYLRSHWERIEWIEETDSDYLNEILDYTENAEHDDAPDSAASLIRQTQNKTVVNLFKGGI